jgi:hypothetical protein
LIKKRGKNLLDMIPSKNGGLKTVLGEDGLLGIVIERNSLWDRFARLFARIPPTFTVRLDARGSFVWETINGHRSAAEIAAMLREKFGDDAEPIYERLALYLKLLANNSLILIKAHRGDVREQ